MNQSEVLDQLKELILCSSLPEDNFCYIANEIIRLCGGKTEVEYVGTDEAGFYVINE